ncbi:cellulase family glycosylhydrolase [Paenibacillus sp. FSL H7-0716]|uniref:Exo-1,3-beta-glucanase D n=1 Tax=Paenibacillus odorifer TaxID=189426 RepID=A0A1R0Y818_9BACL|nr:cellulase family glycosylhydrolase [Paenibacillus odorifer]OMD43505.1 hypothetical protein BSK52_03600 [Paenibacillus odorifer]OME16608.1 hypothetical protein BSK47_20340 [Paenibacillus odorifer]
MHKQRAARKKLKVFFSLVMLSSLLFSAIGFGVESTANAAAGLGSADFLKTNGTTIRKANGSGETVHLRGTNAGGWLVQEDWMNPTNAPDQKTMMDTLKSRFGAAVRDQLVAIYEDNYWTTQDFDNLAGMGMNVVRLPFTYMNLTDDNGNLKVDAWKRLDWFVSNCSQRGIYVILDMHGAFGSQNGMDHSGEINDGNQLYGSPSNREKTLALWEKIAEHFNGNPAVAGYDILNEPGIKAAATTSLQWDFYNEIYKRIRAKDSNHIVIMESCWDAGNLPNPSQYGWTNVVYEYHYYPWDAVSSTSGQASYIASKVADITSYNYGVPTYIGEFTSFDQEDAWKNTMSTFNQQGWSWTTWTYKVTGTNSSWGIYTHNPQKVDIYNDSQDTIHQKWSGVGTSNATVNAKIHNVIKAYLPGTVSPGTGDGSATFYENDNYGGLDVMLGAGSYDLNQMVAAGIPNDKISSVKVPFGLKVTLYENLNFGGAQRVLTSDVSQLSDFNDKTSSIKIEKAGATPFSDGEYYLTSVANGGVVTADNAGAEPLAAIRPAIGGAWETLSLKNNNDGSVSFLSQANQKYICAVIDESNQLLARSTSIGTWEKFQLVSLGNGTYGIKAGANGKFVQANMDSGGRLEATKDQVNGAWESFKITKVGDSSGLVYDDSVASKKAEFFVDAGYQGKAVQLGVGTYNYNSLVSKGVSNDAISSVKVPKGYKVTLYNDDNYSGGTKVLFEDASSLGSYNDKASSLKIEKASLANLAAGKYCFTSIANNKVVTADNSGKNPLVANRDSFSGAWETFTLVNNSDGTVSFRSAANNQYLTAVVDEDSQLLARSTTIGTWERFYIESISGGQNGIYAAANGKYIKSDQNKGGKLLANSETIAGAWEAFWITPVN